MQHGRTGFLVEDADAAAYARFAIDVCTDSLLQAELGAAGAAMAGGYAWSLTADLLCELYARLTSRALVDC